MATSYVTQNRYLYLNTPLGPNQLMLTGFTGEEAISRLFRYELGLMAEQQTNVPFEKLLGQGISFGVAGTDERAGKRHLHGVCIKMAQLNRDGEFTFYRMEVVPQLWMLTQKRQSRIFQQKSVPDILKEVLAGLEADYEILGNFQPREYCVQYRETDFDFASRLMEEEGIYYFFEFTEGKHKLVLANTPQSHPDLEPESQILFDPLEGGMRWDLRITSWEKFQDLRSGKWTLWDHHFQLPHKHLETEQTVLDGIQTGKVNHKLKVGRNDSLEIYHHPGSYAKRFDGVNKAGGEKLDDLTKIYSDNKRTVGIRMEETETQMLLIRGAGNHWHLTPGYKFALERHFNGEGRYVVVSVSHKAREGSYRADASNEGLDHYENTFTAIPLALPYRPPSVTQKPTVLGCQTAVVVGPAGEEIFTDKYGRVKVQFHWDRGGRMDANSSCWIRVGTLWAGKHWGAIHIPRIGHEVIVDFLEGDPDQPIIVGSVFNADTMPLYELPANKTRSGVMSHSSLGGGGFNEIRFEDKKGSEEIWVHGQKDLNTVVLNNETREVGVDRTTTIKTGNESLTVQQGNRTAEMSKGNDQLKVTLGDITIKAPVGTYHLEAKIVEVQATATIKLTCGASTIEMTPGTITLTSPMIKLNC